MKHLIMGTAGHIDHGKTTLVKALTGIDCDTHQEERRRGITINLGFAHLDLPGGDSIGIVDVPGHRDFVHTMVGGASGIDFALLVVAAESGVMPQTREHLQVMEILGIKAGLIALTKIDLVEPDIAEMAEEEIRDLVRGTFLEGARVVRVSAVSGEGLDSLVEAIEQVISGLEERPAGEVFRMFPDRIFTVAGFGTVVTGSVLGGSLKTGDGVRLLPGDGEYRVRRLERHGREVQEVVAGDRASVNLAGLERGDFRRGMVIADRPLPDTFLVDARLRLFRHSRRFGLWTQVIFHVGTYEQQAKVHLMDRNALEGGGEALIQVHLDVPCVVQYGDRFVIRNTSSDTTLGGGEIIDPSPLHHRRRSEAVVAEMKRIARGDLGELIASEVRKCFRAVSDQEVADMLNVPREEVEKAVSDNPPSDVAVYRSGDALYVIVEDERESLLSQIQRILGGYHRRNPLLETGRTTEELLGILGIERSTSGEAVLGLMLEELVVEGRVKRSGRTWALAGHTVQITPEMRWRIDFVEGFLKKAGMHVPLVSELMREAGKEGLKERDLNQVFRYLVDTRRAYFIEGQYLHGSVVDSCRQMLLKELEKRGAGMTVAEFRDVVQGNRKICLLLLGIYDAEGVTAREGDLRVLTEKGRDAIER